MSAIDRSAIALLTVLAAALWSLLVGASLYWGYHKERQQAYDLARQEAVDHINKDLTLRRWVTAHGGVYVPIDEATPPNPYLNVPSRDVETTGGRQLTLMNPAYVLRQMHEQFGGTFGVRGHITSLKPVNPKNAPDPWERQALETFERGGNDEVAEVVEADGKPAMRVMRAMRVETGCLKCHAKQGYKEGDIRGGISSTVTLEPYLSRSGEVVGVLVGSHGAIWLVGLLGIGYINRRAHGRLNDWERQEEELRLAAQVFEGASEGVVITDPEARIIRVNQAFGDIFGYREDEVVGLNPSILKSGQYGKDYYAAMWAEIKEKGSWRGEIWNRRKDGQIFPEWLSITTVRDKAGRVVNYVGIFTDLSVRLRAEQEIRDLNESLERRVRQRTADLEGANRELESFSYSVSHDLRAPLRAINGYARIIRDEEIERLSPEGRQMLERIWVNAERMGTLIDDILRFSRVARSEMSLATVDMTSLAKSVVAELAADYGKARVAVAELPAAAGDETMLRQLWVNLIGNALKFSAKREQPEVEIGAREENGATVYFVRDNGAGFDMAAADRLFGVFQRMHRAEDFPGTGAGLAIVKRIVERHGGRIWAEAAVDAGASFHFTLGQRQRQP